MTMKPKTKKNVKRKPAGQSPPLSVTTGSAGSKRRGLCGKCNANIFIAEIERGQRRRLQRMMWNLCDENRRLGGTHWKTILRLFKMKESDVWPSLPNAAVRDADQRPDTQGGDCPRSL